MNLASVILALAFALPVPPARTSGFSQAIQRATARTVKIYGAKIGKEKGFGTGIIVSPDGFVVTVASLLLEAENLRVVTPDGHIYQAEVVYRDENRQLALLKLARHPDNPDTHASVREQMSAMRLPYFELGRGSGLMTGDWILAAGNPFKIADGDENVSVMKGIVSGRAKLNALQGTQPFPYRGEVILIDAITAIPGAPGSALVDLDGRLVGLIGEIVTSRFTNTYLNYAYPVEEISAFVDDARSNKQPTTKPAEIAAKPGYHGIRLSKIAYRRKLPFVQSVAPGSPAEAAGVRRDDLIVSANGVAIPRARAFRELCERLHAGEELSLIIKRDEKLVTIEFTLTERPE
jgi:serine protease Do